MNSDILRVPIIGVERNPILTESSEEPLNWDVVYEKLVNYIKFAAKNVSDQYGSSGISFSEDLFQEGQLLLYHCFTIYNNKPMNQFIPLFKASLWRKLRDIGGKEQKQSFSYVDLEEAYDIGYSEDVVEDMYSEYKLQQAAELLESSPIALTILKEFINPGSRVLWEVSMDMERKKMLKTQGKSVAVPKSGTIKGIHIQRALEIPKSQFTENFKLVKTVVKKVFNLSVDNDDEIFSVSA